MLLKQTLVLTLLTLTITLNAHKKIYPPFAVSPQDVAGVLAQTQTTNVTTKAQLPADIAFVNADIKYKNGSLKFCECGDSVYMSFRDTDLEFNNHKQRSVAPYWGIFWNYLAQFNLPIWHVEDVGAPRAMALEELERIGGHYAQSLDQLEKSAPFKSRQRKHFKPNNDISTYAGIIVYRTKTFAKRDGDRIKQFKKNHPDFLVVNAIARDYVKRKDETYKIFAAAGLDSLIPRFNMYPSTYTPELATTIINDLKTNKFVIKPPYSSLSVGVNAIDADGLDDFLRLILQDKKEIKSNHRGPSYWRKNSPSTFVATEYVPSKTIYKDTKPYDPTMRIVFMLCHTKGVISFTPVAGFWKIPVKPLNDPAALLTEKHITIAHAGDRFTGILADKNDWADVVAILGKSMPQLYQTMLEQNI